MEIDLLQGIAAGWIVVGISGQALLLWMAWCGYFG